MQKYIFSVVGAAIICAVIRGIISEKSANGQIIKLLCGVFLALTIIRPLTNISFAGISNYITNMGESADFYIHEGKTAAQEEMSAIIKSETEAYILDKANRIGLSLAVSVELDANRIPCAVALKGDASPYAKEVMGAFIEENLGIAEVNQQWK